MPSSSKAPATARRMPSSNLLSILFHKLRPLRSGRMSRKMRVLVIVPQNTVSVTPCSWKNLMILPSWPSLTQQQTSALLLQLRRGLVLMSRQRPHCGHAAGLPRRKAAGTGRRPRSGRWEPPSPLFRPLDHATLAGAEEVHQMQCLRRVSQLLLGLSERILQHHVWGSTEDDLEGLLR